jgi:hypothetical protein
MQLKKGIQAFDQRNVFLKHFLSLKKDRRLIQIGVIDSIKGTETISIQTIEMFFGKKAIKEKT